MESDYQNNRLEDLLLQSGLVNQDQLRIALIEQKQSQLDLPHQLVQLGFVEEAIVRDFVARSNNQESIDLSTVVADNDAIALVPQSFARQHRLLPLSYQQNILVIAMTNVFDVVAIDQLRKILNADIQLKVVLASEAQLEEHLDKFYGYTLSVDGILQEIGNGVIDYQSLDPNRYTQPVVRLVDALLVDAVKRGASDIHLEPEQFFLRIRYRIDGVLQQIRSLHKCYWTAILVRVKVMSGLNISETRASQDGHLHLNLCGRPIDFRVSTHPTLHGENLVMRVLNREKAIVPLQQMNLPSTVLDSLKLMLTRPEGIVLVTGPTGSGKTTTLYSLLSHCNSEAINIMTLEDPVEYPLNLLRQTSLSEAHKLDFASGIRSIMRQDPDTILVGEIRDEETAQMAFRAAMTGHQVFSTLHTNSALRVFPRLTDMGVLPEIMAGNIIGVIAQRLVRVLCRHCKTPHQPSAFECQILQLPLASAPPIYQAQGCELCQHSGYRGRLPIMELLLVDSELDALISRRAHLDELQALARQKGFISLAEDGVQRVLTGHTSIAEITRVVDIVSHMTSSHHIN